MRQAALSAARLLLLAGPTVLAFFTGGYFAGPRAWAGFGVWLLVAVAALGLGARGLPRQRTAWVAIAGLGFLAAWTLLSITWAPVAGSAYGAGQIMVLYLGALLASVMLLRAAGVQRLVEPGLAAGALIVVGYGLSERLLPGVLHFSASLPADGRLEQPLTYWNAMGELAAIGLVLCFRIAGNAERARWLRVAACAASAPLGMGLYLSFSRGALFAAAAGVVALVVLAPRREQLWAMLRCGLAAVLAAAAAAPFAGLTVLTGSIGTRELQGAIAFVLLVGLMLAAALAQWVLSGREREGDLRLPSSAPRVAGALVCAGLALAIVVGSKEASKGASLSGGATRLVSLQSNRYAYWDVALRAFAQEPLRGVGAGGWGVYWLRWRTIREDAQNAHSLPLEVMAELGLVGLAALLVFVGGIALAARRALRATPLAAGPIAAAVVYAVHAPLDWDWQMPALTLVAVILSGAILAMADLDPKPASARVLAEPAPV